MKLSQNDLIISIVAVVLGLGFSTAFFFMKRVPVAPAPPTPVNTAAPALPAGNVVMANSLPGGGQSGGGGGFGAGFGGGPSGGFGAPGMRGPSAMGGPGGGPGRPGPAGGGGGGVSLSGPSSMGGGGKM